MKTTYLNLFSTNGNGKVLLFSTLIAYAITVIGFIAYASLLTYTQISGNNIGVIVTLITVFAVFIGGFDTAKNSSSRGLLWGLVSGLLYSLILLFIAFVFSEAFSVDGKSFFLILLMILTGGVGGVFGINFKR